MKPSVSMPSYRYPLLCSHGCLTPHATPPVTTRAACARQELAPLALDAYPEAYLEFKQCLQLLLLGDGGSTALGASGPGTGPAGRADLASTVYLAAWESMGGSWHHGP